MENTLGNYINTILSNKELSEREAAKLCGLSHSYLNQIINGKNPKTGKPISPTQKTIEKVAKGLDLDINFLTNLSLDFSFEEKSQEYLKIDTELLSLLADLPVEKQKCLIPVVKELLSVLVDNNIYKTERYIPKIKYITSKGSEKISSKFFINE